MQDDPAIFELPEQIFRFLLAEAAAGRKAALIVVTDLAGGSMRRVGSLSAVSENGQMAGYVSNGCIDADIALQAAECLKSGAVTALRYGAGSPFIDLQLPCGGSVDILIDPTPDLAVVQDALSTLEARRSTTIAMDLEGGLARAHRHRNKTHYALQPAPRLILVGRGPSLRYVALQALSAGMVVGFATSDDADELALGSIGAAKAFDLNSPWSDVTFEADRRTAVLLLFHDHIWEAQVLRAAVRTDAFYIGCLGSMQTHQQRKKILEAEGLSPVQIDRIKGPIGLVPSMRSAPFLGISVLAEIIKVLIAEDGDTGAGETRKPVAEDILTKKP